MMKQCLNCTFWDKKISDLKAQYADREGVFDREPHYCIMYSSNIPFDIIDDKKKCPFFEVIENERY